MKKVLVTEKIANEGIDLMRLKGIQVDVKTDIKRDDLLNSINEYDALVVRSATKVDKELMDAAENLKVIGRAGNGMDNIDICCAGDKGIRCVNAPDSNSVAAAEHTIGLLLATCRNLTAGDSTLKNGQWERNRFMGVELWGKTVGIIGLGRIGKLVATRLQAFGMNIIAYDPFVSEFEMARLNIKRVPEINALMTVSDFITVHMPKNKDTVGLIGKEQFALAKPNLRIINCARGGLIDETALYDALNEGKIAGAALDVFEKEPCTDSPLFNLDNVVVTPHLGASTKEAQNKASMTIASEIIDYFFKDNCMIGAK